MERVRDYPKIAIKGYKLGKNGRRLVPDYRHLPVNIPLQNRASKRARIAKQIGAAHQVLSQVLRTRMGARPDDLIYRIRTPNNFAREGPSHPSSSEGYQWG